MKNLSTKEDPEFEVTRSLLTSKKHKMTMDEIINDIRRAESNLNRESEKSQRVKA